MDVWKYVTLNDIITAQFSWELSECKWTSFIVFIFLMYLI